MGRRRTVLVKLPILCWAVLGLLALAAPAHAAATIAIVNLDGPGEGLNDPTAAAPVGGNSGATLGAQRLIVFQQAASIWGAILDSAVQINVETQFDPLFCTAGSATLGSAGPMSAHRDFAGAPVANTWYAQALANSLAGSDLSGSNDISATFNSTLGTTCPFPLSFYLGLDAANPAGTLDLLTVALHEIGHGLGFLSFVDLGSGAKFLGADDAYMRFLEDHNTGLLYPAMTDGERVTASTATGELHWTGSNVIATNACLTAGFDGGSGHVEMFAPNPQQPGSSVSHFSTALTPNALMEPSYTVPIHDPTYDAQLLTDTGWNPVTASCLPPLVPAGSRTTALAIALILLAGIALFMVLRRPAAIWGGG